MSRDYRPYLADIRRACERILRYTAGYSQAEFLADDRTYDAVLRNLAIIGEAAKVLPEELRAKYPSVEWRKIARFRDIVIHHYFAIDNDIIWDIVQSKVPELLTQLSQADISDEQG
jgi:uncharacterized protein with HEPN domain